MQWWWILVAGGVASLANLPEWGLMVMILTYLAGASVLHQTPARRNTLALLLSCLPAPWHVFGALWSRHRWWQRVILAVAMSVSWWPVPVWLGWAIVATVQLGGMWGGWQRDAVRWSLPALWMMAAHAVPVGMDVVMMALWVGVLLWQWYHGATAQMWLAAAGIALWSMTGTGVVLVPWMWTVAASAVPVLTVVVLWVSMASIVAAGSAWGVLVLIWPFIRAVPRLRWDQIRVTAGILGVWLLFPNSAAIARLQPALTPFGDVKTPLWVTSATQQVVAGVPVGILLWGGLLGWAIITFWAEGRKHVE